MSKLRIFLPAATVAAFMALAVGVAIAAVSTDKYDYVPGETVAITGDGMAPGEAVGVDIRAPDGVTNLQHHEVAADAAGNFSDSYTLPADAPAGVYTVVATGLTSGAVFTTTFDPAPQPQSPIIWTGNGTTNGACDTVGDFDDLAPLAGQQGWLFILTNPDNSGTSALTATFSDGQQGPIAGVQQANGSYHYIVYTAAAATLSSASATNGMTNSVLTVSHCENGPVVTNNPPVISSASFPSATVNCQVGTTLTVTFTDPDSTSWSAEIDWDYVAATFTVDQSIASVSSPFTATHTYATPGTYTAAVRVTDNQGATSAIATATITVLQTYSTSWKQPIDPNTNVLNAQVINTTKLGRVVPLKVTLVDNCTGLAIDNTSGKDVSVRVYITSTSTQVLADAIEQYVDPGVANNNTFCFRWTDGFWLYNLDTSSKGSFGALTLGNTYSARVQVANDVGPDGITTCNRTGAIEATPDALLKMMR